VFLNILPIFHPEACRSGKMFRRQQRLKREYLLRKSEEEKKKAVTENKQKVKLSLDNNQDIPKELRQGALSLLKTADIDQDVDELTTSYQDDEYRWAGVENPKIVVTTSRDPSSKLKVFAKELKLIFPNSQRINRGSYELKQLVETCKANDVTDLIIAHETRGNPDGLIVSHLPFGPTAYFQLANVVMRHDIEGLGTISEAYPHLVFNNMDSKLGLRVSNILKHLFPVPKPDSRRVITFSNNDDFISFRHHNYKKEAGIITLAEVGPRFEMLIYDIKLGTIDVADSSTSEWSLRPYMNTAKKRKYLSDK